MPARSPGDFLRRLGGVAGTSVGASGRAGSLPIRVSIARVFLLALLSELGESRNWLFVMLALVPLALTMTLLWKAKEAIVSSVFRPA